MSSQDFVKDPDDLLNYGFDWSDWLGDDTITASAWTLPTGITQSSASNSTTSTTVWLSGGTHGTDYLVTNQITTSGGLIKQKSLKIIVREQ